MDTYDVSTKKEANKFLNQLKRDIRNSEKVAPNSKVIVGIQHGEATPSGELVPDGWISVNLKISFLEKNIGDSWKRR